MTVYVDDPIPWYGPRAQWCHMWTDGDIEELHRMAIRIGLNFTWFQDRLNFPYYDLSPARRNLAIKLGAEHKPLRRWIEEKRLQHVKLQK